MSALRKKRVFRDGTTKRVISDSLLPFPVGPVREESARTDRF